MLQRFVREQLGCGCPDTILQSIRCSPRNDLADRFVLTGELDVGGRLLVIACHRIDETRDALAALIEHATSERDRRGFNRVRLVVAADETTTVRSRLLQLFDSLSGGDEKVHLHVLQTEAVPGQLRQRAHHERVKPQEEST